MKERALQWVIYGCLATLALLHLPFLTADPDINLSTSRDAFTDEGLNTSQLRNYINHGYLDFEECDNLVKTPLYNALLFLPLKVFGTHLIIARSTILILLFFLFFLLSKNAYFRIIIFLLTITTLLQYYVFQYSHFSLSEMLSAGFILAGVFFLFRFAEDQFQKPVQLFLASFLIALSYYSKIQFLYIIPLVPVVLLFFYIVKAEVVKPSVSTIIYSIGWMVFFLFLYCISWYIPHREIFNYVLFDEASGKYATLILLPKTIAFNVIKVLFSSSTWMFNALFLVCFIIGCLQWLHTTDRRFKILFVISSFWIVLEMHKLSMIYLPSRYLVSYYFSAGFLSSVVISKMIFHNTEEYVFFKNYSPDKRKLFGLRIKYASLSILALFLLKNSFDYFTLLSRRQYNLLYINEYFSNNITNKNQLILGPWAPSLTWDSKAISKPVWRNFMNDQNIFAQHPLVIISEPDEAESNQAYSSQGIDLSAYSDSVKAFTVGKWKVNVYWMRQD